MCAGAGDPPEQMEAGREAGHLRPGVVRHLPLLLRHDRVQRLHLCQLAHVHGGLVSSSMSPIPKLQQSHSNLFFFCSF